MSPALKGASAYADLLRRLKEMELQTRAHHERSAALIADAQRIVWAVQHKRRTRPQGRTEKLETLLIANRMLERASDAKSQLLARVAHDLKQPLQVIIASSDMLAPHVPEERQRHIAQIHAAAARMEHALEALLDAARADDGASHLDIDGFPLCDVLSQIEGLIRSQAETKGLDLRIVRCRVPVRSDANALAGILQNLAENAIKYTDRGRVLIGCRRRGDAIEIQVHDTGRGISEADMSTIFEPFRRLAPLDGDGVGLGLAIVQRQAEALGHRLVVRSTVGKGSCFSILVPMLTPETPPSGAGDVHDTPETPHDSHQPSDSDVGGGPALADTVHRRIEKAHGLVEAAHRLAAEARHQATATHRRARHLHRQADTLTHDLSEDEEPH